MQLLSHKNKSNVCEKPAHASRAQSTRGVEELARAATRNEPWGPTGMQLNELVALTHQGQSSIIFSVLGERLQERSTRWRKIYKALQAVEFLAKRGAPCCISSVQQLVPLIEALQNFSHRSSNGSDTGMNVRIRSSAVLCLLKDKDGLLVEREYLAQRAAVQQATQEGCAGEAGMQPNCLGQQEEEAPHYSDWAIVPARATSSPQCNSSPQYTGHTGDLPLPKPTKVPMTQEQRAEVCTALARVLSMEGNAACADCGEAEGMLPTWASTTCGVLLCMRCAGVHRSLGVHVSKVRSVTMDKWTPDLVADLARAGGNARANAFFEALLPPHQPRPRDQEVPRFIFNKYVLRRWAQPEGVWPPPPPYASTALDSGAVIATTSYDFQQGSATGLEGTAEGGGVQAAPRTAAGGAVEAAQGSTGPGAGAEEPAGGGGPAAREAGHVLGDMCTLTGGPKRGAGVELEGTVLGPEVLAVAKRLASGSNGTTAAQQAAAAAAATEAASSLPKSSSAAVLRAAHAGDATSSVLRGSATPQAPPSPPKPPATPKQDPASPTPAPAPAPAPPVAAAAMGDLLGPELGVEAEAECPHEVAEPLHDALSPLPASLAIPSPQAPATPELNPRAWTHRPPFYTTTNPLPPPLLLPPCYPEELRPPLAPLLLPPQEVEPPAPGQFLLSTAVPAPTSSCVAAAPPPPFALPTSPTLERGLEELAAVVPASNRGPAAADGTPPTPSGMAAEWATPHVPKSGEAAALPLPEQHMALGSVGLHTPCMPGAAQLSAGLSSFSALASTPPSPAPQPAPQLQPRRAPTAAVVPPTAPAVVILPDPASTSHPEQARAPSAEAVGGNAHSVPSRCMMHSPFALNLATAAAAAFSS